MTATARRLTVLAAMFAMLLSMLVATAPSARAQTAEDYSILVFFATEGFYHESIPDGIAAIEALGAANNVAVDATEDPTAFTDENLEQYAAVVFLSTTGDVLNAEQQAAFEGYIQRGGGYAGIHAASDTEYDWPWYGDLVGAYFQGHPPGTPTATVITEDHVHPSTDGLPTRWERSDEWYSFQSNPRGDVHVLQALDESTYAPGGDAMGLDHPISWCHDYDGGRSWYTGMGHTSASFSEPEFLDHIWGGIQTAAGAESSDCGATLTENYQKVTLDDNTTAPMALEVTPDGRVFYIQRTGQFKVITTGGAVLTAATLPVTTVHEFGLIGIALDPDFASNNWVYLTYSPSSESSGDRVSRFTMDGNTLDLSSEVVILDIPTQRDECCHAGGELEFDPDGNLWISTGDNTNPFNSSGYTPIDEQADRSAWDAQRSSGNTNSLSGKLLRITPLDEGGYTVPAGNLQDTDWASDKDQELIRDEIYAMGFRNPFRFGIDPLTGIVLLADYGPDAGSANANRGPDGRVEWNIVDEPGNYGWPYCVGDNTPYIDYDFATSTSGSAFDCAAPVNDSPNNTGLTELPPAIPAEEWMGRSSTGTPEVGNVGAPMTSAPYRHDADLDSDVKWPAYWDGKNIFADWNQTTDAWWSFQVDDDIDKVEKINPVFTEWSFIRTMDFQWGPDGSLYVIEWGNGYGNNNPDSGIYKIEYVGGDRSPVARIDADPTAGSLPLDVDFSAARSNDPDGGDLTYAWDFDNDDLVDSTAESDTFTYTEGGQYSATLQVTDDEGDTATASVTINAGNTPAEITVLGPANGGFFSFGDTVDYEVEVTDEEDGTVDCDDVVTQPALGHDQHAHPYDQFTGCSGSFPIPGDTGHVGADIFGVITFTYTDNGGEGGAASLTSQEVVKLNLRHTEAEYFAETGRTADGVGDDDPGVQIEDSDASSAGSHIGFVQDGDWWSMDPANLAGIDTVDVAVGSAGAGGVLELRADSPEGDVIASATVEPTGGWQDYEIVTLAIPDGTTTDSIYFVAQSSDNTAGYLFNTDYMEFDGPGVSSNRAPEVSATATPTSGEAPLDVDFSATATDPEGDSPLTFDWTFGDGQVDAGTDVEHTYTSPGDYTATLTVSDPAGAAAVEEFDIEVDFPPGPGCDAVGGFLDDFEGDSLDGRWSVLRPDGNLRVEDSNLVLPLTATDIYADNNTDSPNIVHTPLPEGDFEITTQVTAQVYDAYQQAGLLLYEDDDNYVKFVLEGRDNNAANPGARVLQLVSEVDASPAETNGDALGEAYPDTVYLRLVGEGDTITPYSSTDGETWTAFSTTADRSDFENLQMGMFALSGNDQPADEEAAFDWFQYAGAGGGGGAILDDFEGSSLSGDWTVIRPDGNLRVEDSDLVLPVSATDIYGENNTDTPNIVVRPLPDGDTTVTTVVDVAAYEAYEQAGLILYQDDDNYVKLVIEGRDTGAANPDARVFQFLWEIDGAPTEINSPAVGADYPDEVHLRLQVAEDGTVEPQYSTNGTDWTGITDAITGIGDFTDVQAGLFALSGTGNSADEEARFDWFSIEGAGGGGGGGTTGPVDPDDEFSGSVLELCRWTDSVRLDESAYEVADGELVIQTGDGDIYQTPNGEPTNFILQPQPADEWTVEVKLDTSALYEQYQQGGVILYLDDDNYVKLDHVVTNSAGNAPSGLIELLSEIDGSIADAINGPALAPQDELWLQMTRSGDVISGAFSTDGETWTDLPETVTNAAVAQDGSVGPFTVGTNQTNGSVPIAFDYFHVVGDDPDATPPVVTSTLLGTFDGTFTPTTGTSVEGTAEMVVEDSSTTLSVDVSGLEPNADYSGHLHDLACGEEGPHYRDDPNGATEPPNELWLSDTQDPTAGFTTDADGNATATGMADWAARSSAQSVMIHVGSTGLPIGCANLDTSSGTVTVQVDATDDGEVAYIEYRLNGGGWLEYTTGVEVSEIGNHTIEYRAIDVDDNTSDIGSADFTIAEEDTPRILVFSKTAGFRHSSIPAGQQAITEL
ncbi:MAG TPA: ThuA domain-containing protein, partial [Nitriliruptoraceae bacterium]|nr:ThuA domain-containing protein [Nitriliruptoraceae bacterium]